MRYRAPLARGFEGPGARASWGVLAKSAGALFIRSYERGERVHLAMLSRGYTGSMPPALADGAREPCRLAWARPHCRSPHSRSACWDGPCDPLHHCRCHRHSPARLRRRDSLTSGERPRLRLPGRPPGAVRRRPDRAARSARRAAGPQRCGQDHAGAPPQRHPHGRGGRCDGRGAAGGARASGRDQAPGRIVFRDPDDQLFMPTVREDVAFGPAAAGLRGAELEARVREALERVGMAEHADRRRTTSPSGSAAGSRWPRCWRAAPRSRPGRALLQPRSRGPP